MPVSLSAPHGLGKMNKRILAAIVIVVVAVSATALYISITNSGENLVPTSGEDVGGKYNVTLSFYEGGGGTIEHTDETGFHSNRLYFEPQMRSGLD